MIALFSRILRFWRGSTTKTKLLIALLAVSVPPLVVAQGILYFSYQSILKEKIVNAEKISATQTARIFDSQVAAYRDLLVTIISDDAVIAAAKNATSDSDTYRAMGQVVIKKQFSSYLLKEPGILSISLLMPDGQNVAYDGYSTRVAGVTWKGLEEFRNSIYEDSVSSPGLHISEAHADQRTKKTAYLIHMSNRLINPTDLKTLGVVVLTIDETKINDILIQQNNESSYFVVLNELGRVVSSADKDLIGLKFTSPVYQSDNKRNIQILSSVAQDFFPTLPYTSMFGCFALTVERAQVLVARVPTPRWYVVSILDNDYFYNDLKASRTLFFGVLITVSIAIVFTVAAVSNRLFRSAKTIAQAMDRAREGNLGIQVQLATKDEMEIVASSFNNMMLRVQALTQRLKEEAIRTEEALKKEKDAEIKALTAQINPHFLYNTLDIINWSLLENEQYESSRMITSLSSILRYSISTKSFVVTIADEYEWLKKYVYLRQCATNNFKYFIDMDHKIGSCKIHKLLLQPVVENAIKHGFEGFISGGILEISFCDFDENQLEITIGDNGQGMEPDMIRALESGQHQPDSEQGVGLSNVLSRLKIYYGESARFIIESEKGAGTRVIFRLPKL